MQFSCTADYLHSFVCERSAAGEAQEGTDLPESVVDLLVSVRDYLQDKCEPPVYVSDRRFMKAIQLLQVAAYTDGREEVSALISAHPRKCTALKDTVWKPMIPIVFDRDHELLVFKDPSKPCGEASTVQFCHNPSFCCVNTIQLSSARPSSQ